MSALPASCSSCRVLQVDFGVDLDSRVALVGPNGAGKSTLLKLMVGTLEPLDGMVKRHNHLKIGQYHQHLTELLDPELTPLEYMVGTTTLLVNFEQHTSICCANRVSMPDVLLKLALQLTVCHCDVLESARSV